MKSLSSLTFHNSHSVFLGREVCKPVGERLRDSSLILCLKEKNLCLGDFVGLLKNEEEVDVKLSKYSVHFC